MIYSSYQPTSANSLQRGTSFRGTHVGDEAALENSQQRTRRQEGRPPGQLELADGDDGPEGQLGGYPAVGAGPLRHELGG